MTISVISSYNFMLEINSKMRIKGSSTFSVAIYLIVLFVTLLTHGPIIVRAQSSGNQTRLRIAVPPKSGFTQFVKISRDPATGQLNFSGFAIEVFNQAVSATVDKSISFEFVPYQRPDGTMNGTYDDMMEAVFNKEYDGSVGDITVRFSRTRWVDFTVSYADLGISMLVPLRQQTRKETNSLISLTQEMVIGTFIIFVFSIIFFVGAEIVEIVLGRTREHSDKQTRSAEGNDVNARNRLREGKDAWRRELLGTVRGTRLMMLLWFLIILYLITYYASSLTSLLAKEHSSTSTKSVNQIIRTGERVGHYAGSFVYDLLKVVGIPDKQLFAYHSEDELLDMISKGNTEGGITVAFDETTHLTVFLAQHCNNFSLVPVPNLHSSGYGFAFPIGSKLVQQVSNGIIKLIDNGGLGRIRTRTIGGLGTCDVDLGTDTISNIATPNHLRIFKACAIVSVALLVVTYAVFIVTSNRKSLRYLFP